MLRDVFYFGAKPNVHPREQFAKNLVEARKKATTEHFWIINEFCDYTQFDWDFDFEFLHDEDVWAENHNNVWPSYHQKDSGTWLCPKERSDIIVYRGDVDSLKRKNTTNNSWKILENIDTAKWDFSWHPDPTDPPYIYRWGSKYAPAEFKSCIEYQVDGATDIKYMNTTVELLPNWDCIKEIQLVDQSKWDMSWRPDPMDPPFIYVWGNKYIPGSLRATLEYHAPGATEKKYMPELVPVLPEWDRWEILHEVDKTTFDFSWRPDPREPDFIYVFGNTQYEGGVMPTIEYHMPNATERKYLHNMKAKLVSHVEKFEHLEKAAGIDYSWVPDPTAPPYIYAWGNQWNKPEDKISIQYVVEGGTEYKFMTPRSKRKPCMDNWEVPVDVDTTGFDFSWEPSPADPAYIYEFGTQWQKTGGPRYVVEGATEVKYIEFQKVKARITSNNWTIPKNLDITGFDFSWHPDNTSPPYIYHFATQWALTGGPIYSCEGAVESKYLDTPSAIALPDKTNWIYVATEINEATFDFSWHPYIEDQPYIYQFGTQHQKTGGPRYVTPGVIPTSPTKYIDTRILKAERLPQPNKFFTLNNYQIADFDWSWHPDDTEELYIYVFGNNQYPAEIMPTIEYRMPGATQIKYVMDVIATLDIDMSNWETPNDIDTIGFDFSWKPNPKDPAYIYQFGTQHQKTGGPRYVTPGAVEIKYISAPKVNALPNEKKFIILNNLKISDFDWSWHPDDSEEPYIYVFGNNQYPAEIMPTIQYSVPGATQIKYVSDKIATLAPNIINWEVPENIDASEFDFSWNPNPKDPAYIYQFGTQWQKTGGPRYVVEGATEVKYVSTPTVTSLPNKNNFRIVDDLCISDFDWSWHPDDSEEPYIYIFGNNQYPAEIMPTIEYAISGATQIKYVSTLSATLGFDTTNWVIPNYIDTSGFDFSWKPNPKEPAYIYEFGTQHQKTGGPRYVVEGATEVKYIDTQSVKALPTTEKWSIPNHIDVSGFDFSWHPDSTSPPYTYHFATQWALTGGPIYKMEGATEVKYLETPKAVALPNRDNWYVPEYIDDTAFDFSWHPYIEDQPYRYQFGTQHQKTGGPMYITPGVIPTSPTKYIDTRILKSIRKPSATDYTKFSVLYDYKIKDFDWSWHPDETDEPYVYVFGNNQYPPEEMPTIEYRMPGATQIKYVHSVTATLDIDMTNWKIPNGIDTSEFDFSWKPNPKEPAYIYQFGTQWQKTGGPSYIVSGATQVKYVPESKARSLPTTSNWVIPDGLSIAEFDFSWHPDSTELPYIYQFGTQWVMTGGPRYVTPSATNVKYMDVNYAIVGPSMNNWVLPETATIKEFDFSWHPHPDDPMFVYHFATQWHDRGGPEYHVSGANKDTPIKYIDSRVIKATLGTSMKNWEVPNNVDTSEFDFSWVPHPNDPPYIYQFGTQWQKTGGPRYIIDGATDIKYVDGPKLTATRLPSKANWFNPQQSDVSIFDYSWHPDDIDPPYIYQFGTLVDREDGPRYITPNTSGDVIYLPRVEVCEAVEVAEPTNIIVNKYYIETTLAELVKEHPSEVFWALNSNIDYANFDFDWRPEVINISWESDYVNVFGSPDSHLTHTYFVNAKSYLSGKKDLKFIENTKLDESYLAELFIKSDIFFVDRGNESAQNRFEDLKNKFGNRIQKTRYLNSWVDTINRCINRSSTNLCWILNSELDYRSFDFDYYPNPWQMKMVHVFGTQWSHWGTTFMINRDTFATDTKYIKIIEHLSNLNFVKDRSALATNVVHDIIYIDHGNLSHADRNELESAGRLIIKYDDSYFNTFKNLLTKLPEKKEHFIWIASTVCDYFDFDFTYICDPFAREQLHVFPSNTQKFGDTFFVNVNRLREVINDMKTLTDYGKINYNQHQRAERIDPPKIVTEFDSHVASVMTDFSFPYAVFVTSDNQDIKIADEEPMNLWDAESKTILITSTGGTRIIVPKEAKQYVETQLYDYPYIKTAPKLAKSRPLDIVYLSNGESCAEENYEHLLKITKGVDNRIVRVDGVNGRVQAYHAAANASNTPWLLTVFAKLKLNAKFDFNWQPDRLQIPKHYMFLAKNPVNGLMYGHQGMIAYNKQMVLDTSGYGLDFTLDSPHETVELLSGIATYNTDAWSTWRTAFREVVKLKKDGSEISANRLQVWLNKADGNFAEYSLAGAQDGIAFYDEVDGKVASLRLSYEWEWLRERFEQKYNKK